MTTSKGWDPDPTTTPSPTLHTETTPIADELTATAGTTSDDTSAKDRAQDAASTAKEQGSDVAATAADEAKQVAEEAKEKATDLLADVKTQVDEQSRNQLQTLSSKIGELGDELDGLISGEGATNGTVTDLARQLSDRTRALSNHLADREPMDLVQDVQSFARRRPGTFLIGAAAAGLIAGRLTRGAKKANETASSSNGSTSSLPTSTLGATPAPTGASTYQPAGVPSGAGAPLGQTTGGLQ